MYSTSYNSMIIEEIHNGTGKKFTACFKRTAWTTKIEIYKNCRTFDSIKAYSKYKPLYSGTKIIRPEFKLQLLTV